MRVQITLSTEDGEALCLLAEEEDRTVAGQARHMLRWALIRSRHDQWRAGKLQDPQSVHPDSSPDAKHAEAPEAVSFLQGEHQPETHDVTEGAGPAQLGGFKHTDEPKTLATSKG